MPVSHQARRFKALILAAMACCLTVGPNAMAQDIVLGEDDFEVAKPAQQITREGLIKVLLKGDLLKGDSRERRGIVTNIRRGSSSLP